MWVLPLPITVTRYHVSKLCSRHLETGANDNIHRPGSSRAVRETTHVERGICKHREV